MKVRGHYCQKQLSNLSLTWIFHSMSFVNVLSFRENHCHWKSVETCCREGLKRMIGGSETTDRGRGVDAASAAAHFIALLSFLLSAS